MRFFCPQDATRVSDTLPPIHFEPQVAFLCNEGQSFHPQYMSDQGRWTTDPESKVSCLKDKVDVLTYCKKVSVCVSSLGRGASS